MTGGTEQRDAKVRLVYDILGDWAPSDVDIQAGTDDATWWLSLRDAIDDLVADLDFSAATREAVVPTADTTTSEHAWRATGGNGTATVVSRIGGPAFAVLRHGKPAIGLAEMVAAALNAAPWLTPSADVPAADTATQDQP